MADIKINEKLVVSQTGTAEPVLASNVDLSSATGIPAAGITGVLPVGVTGGSGLDALPNTSSISKWSITAFSASGTTDPITSWTRVAISSAGGDVSEGSGIFTFPSTGLWEVSISFTWYVSTATAIASENVSIYIDYTDDNGSSWNVVACGANNFDSPANDWWRTQTHAYIILDITDTSVQKVKFHSYAYTGTMYQSMNGDTTGATRFRKLGET